jgi:hypothetical protein
LTPAKGAAVEVGCLKSDEMWWANPDQSPLGCLWTECYGARATDGAGAWRRRFRTAHRPLFVTMRENSETMGVGRGRRRSALVHRVWT